MESAPYVGSEAPARDKWIELDGMRFYVEPLNDIQTLYIDRQPFYESVHRDRISMWERGTAPFRIRLWVLARDHDMEFLPMAARLHVAARRYVPAEFQVEGPILPMKPQESPGGKPGEVIFLVKRGEQIKLTLHYDVPPPSPDEDFELDLGPTIVGPMHRELPIVKFKPIPWSYDSRNP